MYYLVYQVNNLLNGKIYIGIHATLNPNDSYMGSGKHLKHAQKKYGIENFEKCILHIFNNPDAMFEMEALLVNGDFVSRDDTYNIGLGGKQPLDYVNEQGLNIYPNHAEISKVNLDKGRAKLAYMQSAPEFKTWREDIVKKGIQTKKDNNGGMIKPTFTGKKHSTEAKQKIGTANSKIQSGSGNSQYGTCWIHSLEFEVSKKIKLSDLEEWIKDGWVKGRKIKW